MKKIRIGRHINVRHGLISAPMYASQIGCTILQVFLGVPQQILSKPRAKNDLIAFGEQLQKYDLICVVHASYTINLCNPENSKKFNDSLNSLTQDLNASEIIGERCIGVIIHMGKNVATNNCTNEIALINYVWGLKNAIKRTSKNTTIILETGASQGTEIGSKIDALADIYWLLDDAEKSRIKFCIDTCHIFATGYNISTRAGVADYFTKFDELIGIDKISCIHFNDSKTPCNSHVDRHADIGYGRININGLKHVAKFAKKYKIPLIMETPLDAVNAITNTDITFNEELTIVQSWLK